MIGALFAVFYLDNQLDRLTLSPAWQSIFMSRPYLPRGLLVLLAVLVLIVLGAKELCHIFHAKGIAADRNMVTLAAMSACLLMYAMPQKLSSRDAITVFSTLVIVVFLITLIKHSWTTKRPEGAVLAAAVTMFALIYMGLLPGVLITIRRWYSAWVVAAIVLITKSCDIGAYFTGRAIGRHKLIPWLSPGKTWEGLVGGVVLSAAVAAGLAYLNDHFQVAGLWQVRDGTLAFVPNHFDVARSAVAGAAMGLVGQFGDLVASLFKRDAGIKDSGKSIPGFGGILDVVDSPIIVAPLAYWLLVFGEGLE